jgi:hypothetical protein
MWARHSGTCEYFGWTTTSSAQPTSAVIDELPLDLSVVAGVLTRPVRDKNSHVNLKSKERNISNAMLRDASLDHPRLAASSEPAGASVVAKDDILIELTTEETIAAKLAERMDRPLMELAWEPESELPSYDQMAAGTAREARRFNARYGSKAANLGFLAHPDVLGRVTDQDSPSAERGYDLVARLLPCRCRRTATSSSTRRTVMSAP